MLALQRSHLNDSVNTDVLNSFLESVRAKMDPGAFNSWILPVSAQVSGDVVQLFVQNQFSLDFIRRTYMHFIDDAASTMGLTVALGVGGAAPTGTGVATNDNVVQTPLLKDKAANRKSNVVNFDSFVSSEYNAFAVSACKKLATGAARFSPLFMYGPAGCGKSLLSECLHDTALGRTLMMTGNGFVSEFQRAITNRTVFAFKDFVRNCDTFILDDVNALCGKRATSEEFLHTLVDLIRGEKNVVLTANAAPTALSGLDRRLQSVLASGLVVDLAAPDISVRRAMLVRAGLAPELAGSLAARMAADGHVISGLIKKIRAYIELMNMPMTLEVAEKLLADSLCAQKTPIVMVKNMAAKLGVSMEDVASNSRMRVVVRARQIMMAALKSATNLSLSGIGQLIGDRDHATVLYALAQIEKLKSSDLILAAEIEQMAAECK